MSQHQQEETPQEHHHHIEGVGRHGQERKRVDESIRRPSYTPQQRTGQESDTEPEESKRIMGGTGATPPKRTKTENVEE